MWRQMQREDYDRIRPTIRPALLRWCINCEHFFVGAVPATWLTQADCCEQGVPCDLYDSDWLEVYGDYASNDCTKHFVGGRIFFPWPDAIEHLSGPVVWSEYVQRPAKVGPNVR